MAFRDCLARAGFDEQEAAALDAEVRQRLTAGADEARVADRLVLQRLQAAIEERNQLRAAIDAATPPARENAAPQAAPGLAEPPDLVRTDAVVAASQAATAADVSIRRYVDAGLIRADDPELLDLARITDLADRDLRVVEAAGFCLGRG